MIIAIVRVHSFLLTLFFSSPIISFSPPKCRAQAAATPGSGRCQADKDRPMQPARLAVLPSAGETRGGGVSSLFARSHQAKTSDRTARARAVFVEAATALFFFSSPSGRDTRPCPAPAGARLIGTGPFNPRGWPSYPQRARRAAGVSQVSPLSFSLQAHVRFAHHGDDEQTSSPADSCPLDIAFSSLLHVAAAMRRGSKPRADPMST
jgi:hypothetical protein